MGVGVLFDLVILVVTPAVSIWYSKFYDLYFLHPSFYQNSYAPNFEKVGSILLSACPFVCPFVQKNLKLGF